MYYIGIDIGGMSIKGGLVDENGVVYAKKSVVTKADAHYSVIIKDIADLCISLVSSARIATRFPVVSMVSVYPA